MSKSVLLPALAAGLLIGTAQADEITDQIKAGAAAYEQQDYQLAVEELNYALAQIQEKLNAANATLLPEPLPGWTAEEVENTSGAMVMMGGGTNMSRTYRRDSQSVQITIIANSPVVSGMMAMLSNPMVISSNPDMKPYRYQRMKGVKETSGDSLSITLGLAGQVMIKLEGEGLEDEKVLEEYLDAMDFKRIQSALIH